MKRTTLACRRDLAWVLSLTLVAGSCLLQRAPLGAEPFIPARDGFVLERVRSADAAREHRRLKAQPSAPTDRAAALASARRYLDLARVESDARALKYAARALAPWLAGGEPDAELLTLRAIVAQGNHEFNSALMDLDRAIGLDPDHVQAWLTRTMVLQVQGRLRAAMESSRPLFRLAREITAVTVACSIPGGGLAPAKRYETLGQALRSARALTSAQRAWSRTVLGEIALEMGNPERALRHFQEAMNLERPTVYLLATCADVLLEQQQAQAAVDLLAERATAEPVLLRLAIAQHRLAAGAADLASRTRGLANRFSDYHARGNLGHLREEALFHLSVTGDLAAALRCATKNWTLQKELVDARLLLEGALAANDPAAAAPVLDWIASEQVQDARLVSLRTQLLLRGRNAHWGGGGTPPSRPKK